MSWWNAMYSNDENEYEIVFASKDYEKTKAVEKVCAAIMDGKVCSPEDVHFHGLNSSEASLDAMYDACKVVCQALEKLIPKKVISEHYYKSRFYCPSCNERVFEDTGKHKDAFAELSHCPFCGQLLDWNVPHSLNERSVE